MNITITDNQKAEIFTSIFKDIKLFTNDINIMFEPERLYIQSMDSAHVMLFEIILPKSWFSKYEITAGSITVGISSVILSRILSTRDKSQTIEITYNDDHLSIHFQSTVKGEFTKHFEAPLIDIDLDMLNIPDIDDNVDITMESKIFSNLINQLKDFGDSVEMVFSEEKIIFTANSDEKMSVDIPTEELDSFTINEGSIVKLMFSLKYLQNICKYNKISKFIGLKINESHPMKFIYYLTDETSEDKMVFYLAPKLDDDEN